MNQKHISLLKEGASQWNQWKRQNPHTAPDFQDAGLSEIDLSGYNLSGANFTNANLSYANLIRADLSDTLLVNTRLNNANLCEANLKHALIYNSSLFNTNLMGADLTGACLQFSIFVKTNFENATLDDAKIFGISVWDVKLDGAKQKDLVIAFGNEPEITVDNLEVAQFIYMLTNNERLKNFTESVGSKVVLILGRFSDNRLITLRRLKKELRELDYIPILFDFARPNNRNAIETVVMLASFSKFIVADFSDARTVNAELIKVVENTTVPFVPIIIDSQEEPSCVDDERLNYLSILDTLRYKDDEDLISRLRQEIIEPVLKKIEDDKKRAEGMKSKRIKR